MWVIDEISRSSGLLREVPDFENDNFNGRYIMVNYIKGFPLKVADLRIVSAIVTAAGDNGA